MTVDFVTFCCHKDVQRLHAPGMIESIIKSHGVTFDQAYVVYQNISQDDVEWYTTASIYPRDLVIPISTSHYPEILTDFGIKEDAKADEMTHGPSAAHYWKWHIINHLVGLKVSNADYIVFSDCDCNMISQPEKSWVQQGIDILKRNPDVLIVSPSDGAGERKTQNVSQQLFLCERTRLANIDFDIPWDWEFLAPGEPMQEYYYMLEGRIWRYMHHNKLYRYVLPDRWRYWHNQW